MRCPARDFLVPSQRDPPVSMGIYRYLFRGEAESNRGQISGAWELGSVEFRPRKLGATAPEVGDGLAMVGVPRSVKSFPLLATPSTVTTTAPELVPAGTIATIKVALHLVIAVAVVPLNAIVLVPCVAPKFAPVIVTDAPTAPEFGDKLEILGSANRVAESTRDKVAIPTTRDLILVMICSSNCLNSLSR